MAQTQGWICPRCQASNAPNQLICNNCSKWIMPTTKTDFGINDTSNCSCRRENGGSGVCGCILGGMQITS